MAATSRLAPGSTCPRAYLLPTTARASDGHFRRAPRNVEAEKEKESQEGPRETTIPLTVLIHSSKVVTTSSPQSRRQHRQIGA